MQWAPIRWALPAVIASSTVSCYFLSNFDNLEGGSSTTSTISGSGGSTGSSSTSTSSQTGSASSSSSGAGGSGGGDGGTGGSGCAPPGATYVGLVLNELAPKGLPDDWIELRNNGPAPIALCGVMVTQDYDDITIPSGPDRFTFGEISLAPGKYLVIATGPELPYGLAKDAPERITLFSPDGTILDETSWMATVVTEFTPYESWARIPDGTGAFTRGNNPTKGTSNFMLGMGSGGDAGGGGAP